MNAVPTNTKAKEDDKKTQQQQNDIKSPTHRPTKQHTPLIGGNKVRELKKNESEKQVINGTIGGDCPIAVKPVSHVKKWGERTHSWKPAQFESVQALVEKGW